MRTCRVFYILVILYFFGWTVDGSAPKIKSSTLPIQSEVDPQPSKAVSGCSFGGKFYALEDTWHPDLGEPFGVMHCVVCYCESNRNRRGKVFGKVSCKNIKHDCPETPCSNPVLLPGHCCKTCVKAPSVQQQKKVEPLFDGFEYFQDKEDDLHKSYNDRSYISSEDVSQDDSRTDFVSLLTGASENWFPSSGGVARARFTLVRSNLIFSINYERLTRPTRVRFMDHDGTVLFEHPVQKMASPQSNMICGMWRNLHKSNIRLLKSELLQVTLVTQARREGEIHGKIVKHRALFAETFSAILTSSNTGHVGLGGIAMLTLSDMDNNLHFILLMDGILNKAEKVHPLAPILVHLSHQNKVLREIRANITAQDPDFAEVLTDLSTREMFWLSHGQLEISVETQGTDSRRISGFITSKKTCDTIHSVLSGGDALIPSKTGAVGSAKLSLHDNGTLEYQIQVAGTASEVIEITLETKPRRKNKRNVIYDMTHDFKNGLARGMWDRITARDIHMLLQNELFLNVATKEFEEGEVRGQITTLLYSGLQARYQELPSPLAGRFVVPPVRSSSAGHAWISLDDHCHLHYEIIVAGLNKADDVTLNAHLHGFAEIGEVDENSSKEHKRLLKGFYGSEAQGVLKDLSPELLKHLSRGTAFIQVSTKVNPKGEIRGRVHIPNSCEGGRLTPEDVESEYDYDTFEESKTDPEELKKDQNSCFFEGQYRAHGAKWAPEYDKKCSICSCQKRTVICDPIICQPLNCTNTIHPEDKCCPVCEAEKKRTKETRRNDRGEDQNDGCYFEGDRKWHAAGTVWHPFVPPFGYIKCAVCACKGATGEVHCEKVQCPRVTCSKPIRTNPSSCCRECPAPEKPPIDPSDMMQADGPRPCKFGRHWYHNNEQWHPEIPPVGEMKCITCRCENSVTKCQREQCPVLTCDKIIKRTDKCCPECAGAVTEEKATWKNEEAKTSSWGF
ncbi:chordin [Protopterus annectens]|uniref:chordin n=1 Tax=Protopterus annectens TaxID=7888 RepID=UPI001CFBA571|nr:chordin [Protopterus annectens]